MHLFIYIYIYLWKIYEYNIRHGEVNFKTFPEIEKKLS